MERESFWLTATAATNSSWLAKLTNIYNKLRIKYINELIAFEGASEDAGLLGTKVPEYQLKTKC
jgi:hypothetical protein